MFLLEIPFREISKKFQVPKQKIVICEDDKTTSKLLVDNVGNDKYQSAESDSTG